MNSYNMLLNLEPKEWVFFSFSIIRLDIFPAITNSFLLFANKNNKWKEGDGLNIFYRERKKDCNVNQVLMNENTQRVKMRQNKQFCWDKFAEESICRNGPLGPLTTNQWKKYVSPGHRKLVAR